MLPVLIAEYFCLVSGVGIGPEHKFAQHLASRKAGVHDLNITRVTSVLAPGCQECSLDFIRQQVQDQPGRIIYAVDGKCITSIEGQLVSTGLAVTIPDRDDRNQYRPTGFFSEIYEHPGILPNYMKRRVEKGSLYIFADYVGDLDFDPDSEWEDGKTRHQVGGKIVTLKSIVASGEGTGKGNYTCAYVAAILL